jgi:hypothetical protein
VDGGWSGVFDATMCGSLDEVGVVAAAFDNSRVGSVATDRVLFSGYVVQCLGECFAGVFRGKSPPAS